MGVLANVATTVGKALFGFSLSQGGVVGVSSSSESVTLSALTSTTKEATTEEYGEVYVVFAEDYNEEEDGGDSDKEGYEQEIHHDVIAWNSWVNIGDAALNWELQVDDGGGLLSVINRGELMKEKRIEGAPSWWQPPLAPEDWQGYSPKVGSGAPFSFASVDNPDHWNDYMFQPEYGKGKVADPT